MEKSMSGSSNTPLREAELTDRRLGGTQGLESMEQARSEMIKAAQSSIPKVPKQEESQRDTQGKPVKQIPAIKKQKAPAALRAAGPPTASQVTSLLAQAKFNPRQGGPQQIIYDVGNCEYYCIQAKVLIQQAESALKDMGVFRSRGTAAANNAADEQFKRFESNMIEAIRLLTLARAAAR